MEMLLRWLNALCNPFFIAMLSCTILWVIFVHVHRNKLDAEGKKEFFGVRVTGDIWFFLILIGVGYVSIIFGGGYIHFM